jgi:hypothetical protein
MYKVVFWSLLLLGVSIIFRVLQIPPDTFEGPSFSNFIVVWHYSTVIDKISWVIMGISAIWVFAFDAVMPSGINND